MNPILIVVIAAALLGVWGYAGKNRRGSGGDQPSCPPQPCDHKESEEGQACEAPPHCCHQPHCPTPENEEYEVQLNCQADSDYEVVWECDDKDSCDDDDQCDDDECAESEDLQNQDRWEP